MPGKTDSGQVRRALFEREALPHLDALYATALRLVRSPDDANDLVPDTVLRAYRFFHQFTPGTNCRAWLLTILYNNFRNGYRRTSHEQPAASPEDFARRADVRGLHDDPPDANPETLVGERGVSRPVADALDALPDDWNVRDGVDQLRDAVVGTRVLFVDALLDHMPAPKGGESINNPTFVRSALGPLKRLVRELDIPLAPAAIEREARIARAQFAGHGELALARGRQHAVLGVTGGGEQQLVADVVERQRQRVTLLREQG